MISDRLKQAIGDQSLRYAILSVVVVAYGWAAIHFLLAARTVREELEPDAV